MPIQISLLPDLAYHGGNLAGAARLFPDAPRPWLDLSTGINPLCYPVGGITPNAWSRLPEPAAVAELEAIAAETYGVAVGVEVVAVPGTQSLIQLLPRLLPGTTIGILGFTYADYERIWRGAGAGVTVVDNVEALEDFDVAVVVNPNNPDGRLVPVADLLHLSVNLHRRGGLLVVDEAFVDLLEGDSSLIPHLPEQGALVLRSFGKVYGLAGVRLGFAVAGVAIAGSIRQSLGPWAVAGPAIEIGKTALADAEWLVSARKRLSTISDDLGQLLAESGFKIVGATPLFILAEHGQAAQCFDTLGRNGILVRHFPAKPSWLRFGLPKDAEATVRLRVALYEKCRKL